MKSERYERLFDGERAIGDIKTEPEDFLVEEIANNGTVLELNKKYDAKTLGLEESQEGKFSIFVLQKSGWNTAQALRAVAKKFRRGVKSAGFAGTKDRNSVSTQLCSLFGAAPEALQNIHIKDVAINGAWRGNEKIKFGDLLGNRFTVTIRNVKNYGNIDRILQKLNGRFPNYFGEQRFGVRDNNVAIGLSILRGDFEGAVLKFLTDTSNETMEDAKIARKRLANELDFKAALQYFPLYLKYERTMLEYLSRFPKNYANAIRALPRSLSLMLIHSVEDHIFNNELGYRIETETVKAMSGDLTCSVNKFGFPDTPTVKKFDPQRKEPFVVGNIVGYDTSQPTEFENKMLNELGISIESFKLPSIKELNCRGSFRVFFAPYKDLSHSLNEKENTAALGFSLPAGSYATVFLNELVEESPNI